MEKFELAKYIVQGKELYILRKVDMIVIVMKPHAVLTNPDMEQDDSKTYTITVKERK